MGPFTAFAVCLRPGADIAVMLAASAAAAAPPATSSATPRSPVRVAVTLSDRFLAIATVIVPNCLQGLAGMVCWFIQPFIPGLAKTAAISRGGGPATGCLFVVGPSGKRPVTALFTASAAPAAASATAASTTALALLVFTVTPRCGIGLGAIARFRLGSLADGTQAARLVTPFTVAPFAA